jgi:hypothetical protein
MVDIVRVGASLEPSIDDYRWRKSVYFVIFLLKRGIGAGKLGPDVAH